MKNFFTYLALLFLGVIVAIFIAGYIIHDNRVTREAYTKTLEQQVAQITSSVEDSQKKIEFLDEQFKAAQASGTAGKKPTTTTTKKPVVTTTPTKTPPTPSGTVLTSAVVSTHATQADCWIIVSGKVYSVGSYIAMHPGGRSAIVNECGKDATTAFTTRGGTGTHSSSAVSLLGQFFLGTLGATVKL